MSNVKGADLVVDHDKTNQLLLPHYTSDRANPVVPLFPSKPSSASPTSTSSLAKLRWKMISKAVHKSIQVLSEEPPLGSMRRFSSFGLMRFRKKQPATYDQQCHYHWNAPLSQDFDDTAEVNEQEEWFECTFAEKKNEFFVEICFISEKMRLKELIQDFDNTGNVCLWPSEEILAYYCYKNRCFFTNKTVCELGGGMTCLAGLVLAAASQARQVILTDGNRRSLANVEKIVNRNAHRFGETSVVCKQLRWANEHDMNDFLGKVDVIICSDCLYLDQSRQPLVETMTKLLNNFGFAVIFAPPRGSTLQQFLDLARQHFLVEQVVHYDPTVSHLNQLYLNMHSQFYHPDLHYPQLIFLQRKVV